MSFQTINTTNPITGYNCVLVDFLGSKVFAGRISIPEHYHYKRWADITDNIYYFGAEVRAKDSISYSDLEHQRLFSPYATFTPVHVDHFRMIFKEAAHPKTPPFSSPSPCSTESAPSPRCFFSSPYPPSSPVNHTSDAIRRCLFSVDSPWSPHDPDDKYITPKTPPVPNSPELVTRPQPVSIDLRQVDYDKLEEKEEEMARLVPVERAESWIEVLHFFRAALLRWRKDYVLKWRKSLFDVINIDSSFRSHLQVAERMEFPPSVIALWQQRFDSAVDPLYTKQKIDNIKI